MPQIRQFPLNQQQTEAVEWCDDHELVLAGAGSGKTRVLAAKIAYLIREKKVLPWRILAMTFTNKASREMLERVQSMVGDDLRGMQVSTFHSWGLRFLMRHRDALASLGYPSGFVVFDRGDSNGLVKKIARELGAATKEYGSMMENISSAYTNCDPLTFEAEISEKMRPIYERYRAALRAQGALDFDDLMILPLHLLSSDAETLEAERMRTDWVLVDEYQDVNAPQYMLLKLLVGDRGRLMAVGDPDQSIYGWRGADISLIMNFEADFPGARVVPLDRNYRSTGNILAAANSVIKHNFGRREKNLWTSEGEGEPVRVLCARNDVEEAEFLAGEIERLYAEGRSYGDMCILYRMNALSRGYEQALLERGIPHRIIRGVAYFERKEIKDVMAMLRLAVNPRDATS
ncbi:MAG: UvrD-helicase domain-containing protein, partial [Synergistaceae bacterium]|nr:UvrD-helicase domain-containing protein [Synergistaceae bacterium]